MNCPELLKKIGASILVAVLLVLTLPVAVFAQSDSQSITGTLRARDADDNRVPVEGVALSAEASDGTVFSATSDAEGTFAIEIPGNGSYDVTLDTGTLPDGVALRDEANSTLNVTVDSGNNRVVLFALIEGDAAASSGLSDTAGTVARLAFNGVRFGLIMAMCSIGLSLIYGTTSLVNFAHGELVTLGAVFAIAFDTGGRYQFFVAILLALFLSAGTGAANDLLLWRPLRRRGTGLISMMVISIGLSILIRYIVLWRIGGDRRSYSQYRIQDSFEVGPLLVTPKELITMGVSILALVGVAYIIKQTKFGKAMRAIADNRDLAESSGIDVEKIILMVWVLGGLLAGLGGIFLGLDQQVRWNMGFDLLLLIFAAVTLGGLGTAYGALVGSLVVGLFIEVSTLFVPPELKSVGALMILILILLVRPQGILGKAERVG